MATFRSLRVPVAVDAGTGRLAEERDYERHVVQLIHQVLFTVPGERWGRPDFGCGLRAMVFAPNQDARAALLKTTILEALDRWLGTVLAVEDVTVRSVDATLEVTLSYRLLARQESRTLVIPVGGA